MCTDPVERPKSANASRTPGETPKTTATDRSPRIPRMDDLEEAHGLKDTVDPEEIKAAASFRGLTFAQVTNQIWHFCSVDHGQKCMAFGGGRLLLARADFHSRYLRRV